MAPLTDTEKKGSDKQDSPAVLIISRPPNACPPGDWYWKNIAGVPFLLRNVLTLQRGGADPLVLYADKNLFGLGELSERLAKDHRLKRPVRCISRPEELVAFSRQSDRVLMLDGSRLHEKDRVEKLLQPGAEPDTLRRIDGSELQSRLSTLDAGGTAWYEALRGQPKVLPGSDDAGCVRAVFAEDAGVRLAEETDFKDCEKQLISSSRLSNDSFMDRWITRSISQKLTAQWIHTDLTPNQITLISLVVGLISAACFAAGQYTLSVVGAVLLLISAWIDCTDGEIARIKFMESALGKRLDILSDNVVHWALFFCIGLGLYRVSGNPVHLVLGGLAVLGSLGAFLLLWRDIMQDKENAARNPQENAEALSWVDRLANRDFTYLVFLMACIGKLEIFLGLTAIGSNALAGYLLFARLRKNTELKPQH